MGEDHWTLVASRDGQPVRVPLLDVVTVAEDGLVARRVRGERVNAELLPGGGDWLMIGNDGIREQIELEHLFDLTVAVLSDEAKGRLASGERVREHEMHARSQLRFEADPAGPHAWLNAITTVAINELAPNRVDYRVFRVL